MKDTASPSGLRWSALLTRLGPLFGLIFVTSLFPALRPRTFLTTDNFQIMLLQTAVVGTAALGMTMIIIAGGIDLSIGSNIALCTVAVASCCFPRACLHGPGGLGQRRGGLALRHPHRRCSSPGCKLTPFIVTLGTWGAFRGARPSAWANETIVAAPETWLNSLLQSPGPGHRWMLFPSGVWLMLVLTVLVAALLRYTRFGRHIFAVGSNEQTARLCGISVARTKLLTYAVGLAFAGIAGLLQLTYLPVGEPTTANGLELAVIAAVVIGGGSLNGGGGVRCLIC